MFDCHSCRLNADVDALPSWERIFVTAEWRLAHASSALPGYLVLSPRRHVVALDELTPSEAASLGPLLVSATHALRRTVGCLKTYVMLFAEREGWEHLHFHVVPRMPDISKRHVGPGTLDFINRPESEWVPPSERARLAEAIGALVSDRFVKPS